MPALDYAFGSLAVRGFPSLTFVAAPFSIRVRYQ